MDECFPGQLSDKYGHLAHSCHEDANCTNTKGSFFCTCHTGYSGDGVTCAGNYSYLKCLTSFGSSYISSYICLNPWCMQGVSKNQYCFNFQILTNATRRDCLLIINTWATVVMRMLIAPIAKDPIIVDAKKVTLEMASIAMVSYN